MRYSSSCDWKSSSRNCSKPSRRGGTGPVVALSASCVLAQSHGVALCSDAPGKSRLAQAQQQQEDFGPLQASASEVLHVDAWSSGLRP